MKTKTRTNTFQTFAQAVHNRFSEMAKDYARLFVVNLSRDALWETYLRAFPEGTNPIFRVNTEHDCSCCRHFVKSIGGVVAVDSSYTLRSVWDVKGLASPYVEVAEVMANAVESAEIENLFKVSFRKFGAEVTVEQSDTGSIDWHHFFCEVPMSYSESNPGRALSEYKSAFGVFRRGLEELDPAALLDILDLIKDNQLYRGEEHKHSVQAFLDAQRAYGMLDSQQQNAFAWLNASSPEARFRNTVIGTLAQDLSNGEDPDKAVKSFESKVAPQNYKRPKSLITPRMIEDAMKTVHELGLEDALERRYAKASDLSVNNVLFVDNHVKNKMRDSVIDKLMEDVKVAEPDPKQVTEIKVDEFLQEIVPIATSMELFVDNSVLGNFMSLVAPVHPDAGLLTKWDNNFSWSYSGDVTDSVKERVKRAGGKIDAYFRASLSWFNYDDLDIHMHMPDGRHVFYGNKCDILDVDMNAGGRQNREPVENLALNRLQNGAYRILVHQFAQREHIDTGFEVEIECDGRLEHFAYEREVRMKDNIEVCTIVVARGKIREIKPGPLVSSSTKSVDAWGISTNRFARVNMLLLSPNHWDDNSIGNKHLFFILEGCHNPLPIRGIYNEFLPASLEKHRKVFEVLGSKLRCPQADEQLSGVGFSSTKKATATVLVRSGKRKRLFKIVF